MQTVSSRIWTWVTVSISYNSKHYTKDTSLHSLNCNIYFENIQKRIFMLIWIKDIYISLIHINMKILKDIYIYIYGGNKSNSNWQLQHQCKFKCLLMLYSRERQQCAVVYIICFFSFTFITQNVWMSRVRENQRQLSLHTQESTVWIFCESLPLCFPGLYNF